MNNYLHAEDVEAHHDEAKKEKEEEGGEVGERLHEDIFHRSLGAGSGPVRSRSFYHTAFGTGRSSLGKANWAGIGMWWAGRASF